MESSRLLLIAVVVSMVGIAGCVGGVDLTDGDAPWNEDADGEPPADVVDELDGDAVLEIHHIDVGQADATLVIEPGGETMLIDSGDWTDDGETVLAYLDARGVDRIDHLVSTHAHADHVGGHAAVIEHYETRGEGIGAVYDSGVATGSQTYGRYLDAVENHDVTLFSVEEGDAIEFGAADVDFLNPLAGDSGSDLHFNAVAFTITFGDVTYLTTGDAEGDAEDRMTEVHGEALDADVYQAGHHGSATSSTPSFLDRVDPAIAVISSARESQYDHPHDETLESFAERSIETYWTGVHGNIVVATDGEEVAIDVDSTAPTDADALRDEKPADSETADRVGRPTVHADGGAIGTP